MIVIRLPDGRERGISRSATALISASDDLAAAAPSRQAHISVRTLLPLANHVGAVLASRHANLEGGAGQDLISVRRSRPGVLPRLWQRLPIETQRQLAQQVGRLVQRLRRRPIRSEESHRAEHDVVDG